MSISESLFDLYHNKFLIINNNGVDQRPALLFDAKANEFAPLASFNDDNFEADLSCSVVYKGNNYIIGGFGNRRGIAQGYGPEKLPIKFKKSIVFLT